MSWFKTSYGYTIEHDGIYYSIIDNTAHVTGVNGLYFTSVNDSVVNIPETVNGIPITIIDERAFHSISWLKSVNIGNSVTHIGYSAFSGCTALTDCHIGNSVTHIGYSAFSGCTALTNCDIGNSVITIGDYAFYSCKALTDCHIGNSVTHIGYRAFSDCTALTNCDIGNSVITIGDYAFYSCKAMTDCHIGNSVTHIGYSAFSNCTAMTDCHIGNSVTHIGNYAFYGCTQLQKVNITDIAAWCKIDFSFIQGGYANTIDDKVPSELFYGGNPLKEAHRLYLNQEEVTNLIVPETVDSISHGAFMGCLSLKSVDTGSHVSHIGARAFVGCDNLEEVTIGKSIKDIGDDLHLYTYGAFTHYSHYGAFPSELERIILKAEYCTDLGNVNYSEQETDYNELIIDEEVKYLPDALTWGHSSPTIIYFNAKNCILGPPAASNRHNGISNFKELTRIIIGNKVESIGDSVLYVDGDWNKIDTITIHAITPPTITACFTGISAGDGTLDDATYKNTVLEVPQGTLNAYKNATGWKEFLNIVEMDSETIPTSGDANGDGKVSIDDVTSLIDYLLSGNVTQFNVVNADVDEDGSITIADVTALIDLLLSGN